MKIKHYFPVLVAALTFLHACKKDDNESLTPTTIGANPAAITGKYANGFFIANEGWYGHGSGDLHFYDYSADTLRLNVYAAENPGKTLGGSTNTLQFATVFRNKLYIVVKAGGPLVVTDAGTLVETARLTTTPDNDGHAFLGLDSTKGLLTTGGGVYPITLPGLVAGTKLPGINSYSGDMIKVGNYIFVHAQTEGIVAYNAATLTVARNFGVANLCFAQGKDGAVYAAKSDSLLRINPTTLARSAVKLPFTISSPWGAWRHSAITSSTTDSTIFIVRNNGFMGGTTLYRYVIGNTASLATPFITLPTGQYFYGAGAAYDKHNNTLVVTTINGPYSGSVNTVLRYNATTGALINSKVFNGWYFPAMPVFQP
ncbi:DUF5074 domain-containing protein [Chitinophaga rhizophila]|uniref:DUF5074 domain-containing protein n=1 Tax=Chitinophaga rhizophila TaxID=2866212 RepID=A0ABS7G7B8_9BACT|nr:DUF5074 domain-containing protein [Chitinophaga rhizophila]MBW8683346.1 DUF5074 domain-containing protein [Chitinophaga rhizophila]